MKIKPTEIIIIGGARTDEEKGKSVRIAWLVNNYLTKVASDGINWTVLYQDPEDRRYWELNFPNSELHGGGPPTLVCLSDEESFKKYVI